MSWLRHRAEPVRLRYVGIPDAAESPAPRTAMVRRAPRTAAWKSATVVGSRGVGAVGGGGGGGGWVCWGRRGYIVGWMSREGCVFDGGVDGGGAVLVEPR